MFIGTHCILILNCRNSIHSALGAPFSTTKGEEGTTQGYIEPMRERCNERGIAFAKILL